MTLKIDIPKTKEQIQEQVEALEYLIQQDKNDKDRQIHLQAIEQLKKALQQF